MKKTFPLVLLLIVVLIGFSSCSSYNSMVSLEEGVESSWSQVENVYQRRADLIPNLVETVKGAANFEKETLTDVIEARAKATQIQASLSSDVVNDPQTFQKFQEAQGALSGALSRLLVTVERYPDLKANQNYLTLQSQLEGTENRIAVERKHYNDAARAFNTKIRRFPASIIANLTGLQKNQYFQAEAGAEEVPKVKF
ncbi:MAG TPA: LemA family protein [Candidatus Krumholzibacteria bacterium]|nr:LemA family protein [Candidatus Krumholzibacteria bacterium]